MKSSASLAAALLLIASLCSPQRAIAQRAPATPATALLRYDVTLLPGSRAIYVEGRLKAGRDKVSGWIAGSGGLGDATTLPSQAGEFRFAYSVAVPKQPQSNSPDPEFGAAGFRGWGSGLFLVPDHKPATNAPIDVCIRKPPAWTVASVAGDAPCFTVGNADALLSVPILAGDVTVHRFPVGASEVLLAVRSDAARSDRDFERRIPALVRGAADYLRTLPPSRVVFALEQLPEGRKSYAPGNNESGAGFSHTMLIDAARGDNRRYWGTLAHEYMHSWIPRAFGDPSVTRRELGSTFIEGFSDYLAYRVARHSGLIDDDEFLAALSAFYLEYREARAKLPQGNPEFLRYRQGMMAAWVLDLEILKSTGGRAGFRELMRALFDRHLGTDGLTRDELKAAIRTLAGDRVAALYDPLTDIGQPIDVNSHLARTGLSVREVPDFTAAIDSARRVVTVNPRTSAERRIVAWWLQR